MTFITRVHVRTRACHLGRNVAHSSSAHYLVGETTDVNAVVKTYIETRPLQSGGIEFAASDKSGKGPREAVGVDDEMLTLVRFDNGATGSIEATRNAHGRNNFIIFENSGEKGSVAFNCERTNELEVMFADDPGDARGFRTVYTGPADPYGGALWPISALGVGYGETNAQS